MEVLLLNLLKEQKQRGSVPGLVAVIRDDDILRSLKPEFEKVTQIHNLDCDSFFSWAFCTKFRQLIRKESPDVVHAWSYDGGLVAGFLPRYLHRTKVVWGIHALDLPSRQDYHPLRFGLLKTVVGVGSRIIPHRMISCAEEATDSHARFGFPRGRCVTIPNGINTERFVPDEKAGESFRRELGIPEAVPVVGFLGRSDPVKNLVNLFASASLLMDRRPDVHFIALGFTEEQLYPEALEAYRSLPDAARFRIAGIRRDVEKCLPAFTINVLSSDSEALPMVLMEALACGVACVATDVGASHEVVGENGLLVPPRDSAALADAVDRMLDAVAANPAAWRARSRARCVENFSISRAAQAYERVYASLTSVNVLRAS
jgi:glycosyltransferase involved in cell wall biosynthesis